jgi:hypothetical protein
MLILKWAGVWAAVFLANMIVALGIVKACQFHKR